MCVRWSWFVLPPLTITSPLPSSVLPTPLAQALQVARWQVARLLGGRLPGGRLPGSRWPGGRLNECKFASLSFHSSDGGETRMSGKEEKKNTKNMFKSTAGK